MSCCQSNGSFAFTTKCNRFSFNKITSVRIFENIYPSALLTIILEVSLKVAVPLLLKAGLLTHLIMHLEQNNWHKNFV
jgi:hypothetical protein